MKYIGKEVENGKKTHFLSQVNYKPHERVFWLPCRLACAADHWWTMAWRKKQSKTKTKTTKELLCNLEETWYWVFTSSFAKLPPLRLSPSTASCSYATKLSSQMTLQSRVELSSNSLECWLGNSLITTELPAPLELSFKTINSLAVLAVKKAFRRRTGAVLRRGAAGPLPAEGRGRCGYCSQASGRAASPT